MSGPEPGSREWHRLITASKVPAILGLSPWQSPYSLWMQMSGRIDATPETTTTRRGHYLEAGVLARRRGRRPPRWRRRPRSWALPKR